MSENDLLKQRNSESKRISVLRKKDKMSENDQMKQQLSEKERKVYYRKKNKHYQKRENQ